MVKINGENRGKYFGMRGLLFLGAIFLLAVFSGCSSTPKKPVEIFTDRNMAANQLNLANQTAARGRFSDALLILEEARRLALSTDDPALRIKTSTSRGSILFSLGRQAEAFREWENASTEADAAGQSVLAALARLYTIRARIVLLGTDPQGGKQTDDAAVEFKNQIGKEMLIVKADPLSAAAGYVTLGMAEKQLKHWTEAEDAVTAALKIHEKNLYLEDSAYDWFLIASIRSVSGKYDSALEALETAISFDRRAENGFGLASSWQAKGEVYQKAGRPEEAGSARRRAAEIFRAIGLPDNAAKLEAQP